MSEIASNLKSLPIWPYIIGDIHGCLDELRELEQRIYEHAQEHGAEPLLVSVGDLIDRGPDSAGVVEHFFKGEQRGTHRAILGNHELMMLQLLQNLAPDNFAQEGCVCPLWLWSLEEDHRQGKGMAQYLSWEDYRITMKSLWMAQGGYQTLKSFDMDPEQPQTWLFPPLLLQYLLSLPFYWETEAVVITHALARREDLDKIRALSEGHTPLNHIELAQVRDAAHSLIWNRSLPLHKPAPQRLHISGHTPVPHPRRWKLLSCLQIDTGCVFGRQLTAHCLPTGQNLQVSAARNYVASEKAA